MKPRMCITCGVIEDYFYVLNAESECYASAHCEIRVLTQMVETLKVRADGAYNLAIADAQAKILWMLGGSRTLAEINAKLKENEPVLMCAYFAVGDLKKP